MARKAKPLSTREQQFVVAFSGEAAGNATKAAILAGYSKTSARFQGSKLAAKRNIQDAIATLTAKAEIVAAEQAAVADERATIADASERRLLLTGMARNVEQHPIARLKAVDILNKMDGLYIQKHELSGKLTLEQILDASRGDGASA